MSDQDSAFWESEGDNYHRRNRGRLLEKQRELSDVPLRMLDLYGDFKPKRVLEIGCANGWRLGALQRRYGCECVGLDPSEEALADGSKLFPNVRFMRGIAADLPLKNETFDLVIVYFVMHWISRDKLLRSAAEIDRMVGDRGFLLLGDHLPSWPTKTRYHHLPNEQFFTYKQDYAELFLQSNLYSRITRVTFDFDRNNVDYKIEIPDPARATADLLRKSALGHFVEAPVLSRYK